MRILYRALAILVLWLTVTLTSASAAASYGPYTEKEFQCLAHTLWHEGGSTYATLEEQKLMAYSIVVRAKFTDWYQRRDWGGPNICDVVRKKVNHVCQYSYFCTKNANRSPVPGNLWEELDASVADVVATIEGKPSARELWERSKEAARSVLRGWKPEGDLALADTYWHKCGVGLVTENCSPKLMTSERTKCWFKLEQVMIAGQVPVPDEQKHVFFRRLTLEEAKASLEITPEGCENFADMVSRVRGAQREWVMNPDRPFVEKKPELEKSRKLKHKKYFKKKKKKSRG